MILEDRLSKIIDSLRNEATKLKIPLHEFISSIPSLESSIFKGQIRADKGVKVEVLEYSTLVTWRYCNPTDIPEPKKGSSFVYIPEPRLWPTEFKLLFPEVI